MATAVSPVFKKNRTSHDLYLNCCLYRVEGFPRWCTGRIHLLTQKKQEMRVPSLGQEDPLEKERATYVSILAWKIPWRGEPGGLQSMRLQSQS